MRPRALRLIGSCLILATAHGARAEKPVAPKMSISVDHADGVYSLHEPVTFTVHATDDANALHYALKRDGYTVVRTGDLPVHDGVAVLTATIDQPGTLLLDVTRGTGPTVTRALAGAVAAPRDIAPSSPPPKEFGAFWKEQIAKLAAVPMNAIAEAAPSVSPDVDYFKVKLDNVNGSHVYAQLAEPKTPGKHPALLVLQWAGVYGLDPWWVVNPAKNGWMALDVMPHDVPFDQPAEYYAKLKSGALGQYMSTGNADPHTSYFLRMYLSCYRAADYLTHRPDWDGKTLVITGTSQGGQQSIMLAGLYPNVTAMLVMVPSGCDVTGRSRGRAIGFPNWADQVVWANNPHAVETGRYYDPVNFAAHITCPALVSMGLRDETSPPSGVLAAAHQMKGPVELCILPKSNHQGDGGAQQPYQVRAAEWMRDLVAGKPAPVRATP